MLLAIQAIVLKPFITVCVVVRIYSLVAVSRVTYIRVIAVLDILVCGEDYCVVCWSLTYSGSCL